MIDQQKPPGTSARAMARRKGCQTFLLGFFVAAITILFGLVLLHSPVRMLDFSPFISALLMLAILPWITHVLIRSSFKAERRALQGAKGEEMVGRVLANLEEGFLIWQDLPSPFGNIDHIVLSQAGSLFLLETKSHRGRVELRDGQLLINGKTPEKDFISQVWKNTYWLKGILEKTIEMQVRITPILVFPNAAIPNPRLISGIQILPLKSLWYELHRRDRIGRNSQRIWLRRSQIQDALSKSSQDRSN